MIVVTGAYGFIGSCLVTALNKAGFREIIVVDDFYADRKEPNLENKWIREWIHRDIFLPWFEKANRSIDFVFHLGARTSCLPTDTEVYSKLNVGYSKRLWNICSEREIPFVYTSTYETYGDGSAGMSDQTPLADLKPLNERSESKHTFDLWASGQDRTPPKWAGLKLRNVFGPNEYHKYGSSSLVHRLAMAARTGHAIRLRPVQNSQDRPEDHRLELTWVMDVLDVLIYFMGRGYENGIYNTGSGQVKGVGEIIDLVSSSSGSTVDLRWDPGEGEAMADVESSVPSDTGKLLGTGFAGEFTDPADAVARYVAEYLVERRFY